MSRLRVALPLLLLVAAACGPFHQLSAASSPPDVIPWLPLPADLTPMPVPTPRPIPVPAGTPACVASGLQAGYLGSQGATGNVITSFVFVGTGNTDCFLDGTPSVTLLDAAGHALAFRPRAPYFPPEVVGPVLVSPEPLPAPGTGLKYGQASLTIDWVSQPEACSGQAGVTPAAVAIAMPAGGTLTVQLARPFPAYACQGLGVGTFEAPPAPDESTPPPALPAVDLKLGGAAAPGRPYRYMVTLTNQTREPMDLATTCPNYEEEFFAGTVARGAPLGGKHLYRLNCTPAGTLAPGASANFEMIFAVPAGAARGAYTLMFALGLGNAELNPVDAAVTVA